MTEALSTTSDLDNDIKARWFYELDECTFSIFHSGSDDLTTAIQNGTTDELEEIVRGTYDNPYKDAKEFNSKMDSLTGLSLKCNAKNLPATAATCDARMHRRACHSAKFTALPGFFPKNSR